MVVSKRLYAEGDVYAFERAHEDQLAVIVINCSLDKQSVNIPVSPATPKEFQLVWPEEESRFVTNEENAFSIEIEKRSGQVWISNYTEE